MGKTVLVSMPSILDDICHSFFLWFDLVCVDAGVRYEEAGISTILFKILYSRVI